MEHVLSEYFTKTCPSRVPLNSIAHSFIELRKLLCHDMAVIHEVAWDIWLVQNWERSTTSLYCHSVYLTSMQSISYKMPGWMNHKQGSRFSGEMSVISEWRWYLSSGESKEKLKNLLMRVIEESEKAGLILNIHKTKIMASSPITSCQIDGETLQTVIDFIFLVSKITADSDCSHEI